MSSLTPSIILQWSPRLTERQDAFVTFHNRASLSAAKEYPEVSAQVETPMGAPQPAGKPPTIDDPDVGQDKHILMEMQALYAKEIRSLKFIQPKLYAYIFLMLSAEAAAHVKSHISYADANLKKSPHLLLSIIHSLYNSDDADNSPQAAKAAALVSLANFKVLRGELLVTAADRLNRIADAARASKTVGDGVDDLTLAQLYMDGLPRPQFEEYIKVIDNTTSMDPTKAPRNTIELRTSLMKLGAPDKAGQGDDDAHSAMIASVHSEPPSPRPKAGYMCQGCGVHNPDHFPSECPSYTPAQRLILLNKHNERCNDRKKRSIERGGGQAGRAGRGNGKRAEGAAAASKSDAAPHAQRPAATKNKHPKDGPHIQAAAVDFELMAEKVAKKVASRVIQSLHTTEIAPDSDDDSVSGLVAQVECASIDTAAARWGKVQPDMHYYDTGATGHVAPAPHISGDIGFQGSPVRLTGVGGYESKITRRCSAVVRGTYATLVVPGSPSLLSASLLLLTHYVEVDRNGLYYVLEPRDVHEHDYLAFVKTGNGLYPLAEMYASGSASGDPMRRSWANEDVIRSAESNTAKAWRALIQRQVQSRVRVPSSTQVAMQIIACSALDSANVSASPVYTTTPPRPSIWSESPLKTSSMTASHSPKHKTEFALTTFAQKLANASDSIKSNVAGHTLMQIQGAKLAELYLRTLGTSPENLSRMLSKGLISGALITTRDVSTAMDVFGPDPTRSAAWKRSRPPHVDIAPRMTRNNENNVQALDLFKVSGRQILISVFVPASIKMCSVLESKESHAILAAVISHRQDMLERGYKVNVIHSDKEPGLVSKENRKELANLGVRLAEYATEAHVVQIESNVAPTRKRIITLLATCVNKYGYSPPSAFLQPFLDHTCVMNAFAEKEAADGMTPGQNMYGRSVSAAECSFPPGSMCISVISKGAQKGKDVLRGEQVIYLACRASETGTAKVYSLATNKIVIREINELSPMPITQEAVHALNSIYDAERKEEKALIIPRLQLGSRERDIDLTELKIWRSVETDDLPIIIEAVPAPADAKAEAEPPLTCPEMKIHITEPQRIFDREPPPQGGFEGSPYNSGNVQDKLRKIIAIAAITRMETTRAACAFNISVEQAFAEFPEFAEKSITLELENILRRTFRPIDYVRIAKHQKIIPSKMFLKPKWTSSGEFDKLKCRLVGGGHRQNSEDFGDLSAPTLGLTALFALLAIAAFLGQHSKCADVPSAYLNAPLDKQDGPIFVDAAYGTHFDMKSHTGCIIQIGNAGGPAYCKSVKQTIVSKSSTEAELIAASDMSSQIIWLRNFMQAQGHKMEPAILLQDNMSTISLINAGRAKAEKSRHINVRYFWLRDRIEANEIIVEHKPTEDMLADALTKPLTGSLFTRMRELLLNNKKR